MKWQSTKNSDSVAFPGKWNGKIEILYVAMPSECNGKIVIKVIYYSPLANGTAVNKEMSFAISCCQPQNRSAISLTTLILLISVGFVQFYIFFHHREEREGGMGK